MIWIVAPLLFWAGMFAAVMTVVGLFIEIKRAVTDGIPSRTEAERIIVALLTLMAFSVACLLLAA